MISHGELQRIRSAQPLGRMRDLAARLGWRGLELEHVRLRDAEAERANIANGIVIFYMTTDLKFNLQINTYPHGQCRTHRATVKADRYGIVNVGWHDFVLHDDDSALDQEIARMHPWLYRSHFKDPVWRRRLAREHPELPIIKSRRSKRLP